MLQPKYTMRYQVIFDDTPVASLVCIHIGPIEPLVYMNDIYMNWETGLVHAKCCDKPVNECISECWACGEYFWGGSGYRLCIECLIEEN